MSGTDAAAVASVPDMISSILERVPDPVSLFRCSLVCKDWRGLVSDPAFLRRSSIWPHGGQQSRSSASLLGIIVQRDRPRKISKLFPTTAPALVPAPGSVLGPQLRFLTSFVRDDDGILDDAVPLAARDGLLLVRVWRPLSTEKNSGGGVLNLRLCVCNLLTGSLDVLPALELVVDDEAFEYKRSVRGYALFTAADHGAAGRHDARARAIADGYSTLFQVLLLVRGGDAKQLPLQLHRFSSASGDWDDLDCSQLNDLGFREPHQHWGPIGSRVAAVARGTAHWLFCGYLPIRFYTLDVMASTGQVSMTALPVDAVDALIRAARFYKTQWLCTSTEGRLALLCVESNNRLVMMKQRDHGDHWDTNVAEVHVDVDLGFGRESLSPVCFGDRSGIALARSRSDPERRAYMLDLNLDIESSAGSATKVEGWIRTFNYETAAPFEINWPMFFISRLGDKL